MGGRGGSRKKKKKIFFFGLFFFLVSQLILSLSAECSIKKAIKSFIKFFTLLPPSLCMQVYVSGYQRRIEVFLSVLHHYTLARIFFLRRVQSTTCIIGVISHKEIS